jgi:hypothetical protein
MGMAGPAVSMMANWADAYSVARTDPTRALEKVLPKALASPLQAYDRTQRGIVSQSGKEIVAQDEFNTTNTILKSLGFETTDTTDMFEKRGAFNQAQANVQDARQVLLQNITTAMQKGESTGPLMDKVIQYNTRNPMHRIDGTALANALKDRYKAAAMNVGGIPMYDKKSLDVLPRVGL